MADATSLTPTSPSLSPTLLSKKLGIIQPQRTRKYKFNNIKCKGGVLRPPHGTTTKVVASTLSDKGIVWKYSIQKMKTTELVLLSLFMRDNVRCDILHAAKIRVWRCSTLIKVVSHTVPKHYKM